MCGVSDEYYVSKPDGLSYTGMKCCRCFRDCVAHHVNAIKIKFVLGNEFFMDTPKEI